MIRLIPGSKRDEFRREIDEMHCLRKRVFHDRLQWEVNVEGDWEIDEFDKLNPLYLLSIDGTGKVRGSLRLLPSTGPNMLNNVFTTLLPDGAPIESGTIWESSRFSVDQEAAAERSENLLNKVTGELLVGIVEVGMIAGLTEVVSVYDALFARILKRANCPAKQIGEVQRIGRTLAFAGLFDIDDDMLNRLRAAAGIKESVLETQSVLALGAAA